MATVRMMSPATRSSRPSRIDWPTLRRSRWASIGGRAGLTVRHPNPTSAASTPRIVLATPKPSAVLPTPSTTSWNVTITCYPGASPRVATGCVGLSARCQVPPACSEDAPDHTASATTTMTTINVSITTPMTFEPRRSLRFFITYVLPLTRRPDRGGRRLLPTIRFLIFFRHWVDRFRRRGSGRRRRRRCGRGRTCRRCRRCRRGR